MPEIKKSFTQGIMDLGTDARLMQDGVYRYAINVDVIGSESSDQGVVQNIRGNVARGFDIEVPEQENPITIGAVSNESENKIYYFWVSRNGEGIYEYDVTNVNTTTGSGTLSRILEFTHLSNISNNFLNFHENNLITGATVVDNLLIFTDGINPIRKINIDRFRNSGVFKTCPTSDGEYICPEGVTTRENPKNPGEQQFHESSANPTHFANGDAIVELDTDTVADELEYSDFFSSDLINLAKKPPLFPPKIAKIIDGIDGEDFPTDEDEYQARGAKPEDRLFDTMARFAIRYRYTDGETSAISPFSPAAFLPRKYQLNTDTGIMESMTNYMRAVEIIFDVGEQEVKEIDIIYKESDSSSVYLVDTIHKETTLVDANGSISRDGEPLKNSTRGRRNEIRYTYDGSKIYRLLPSSELARIYDNVPITAKTLDMAGNRLVLGNFVENYTFTRHSEEGEEIIPDFDVQYVSDDKSDYASNNILPFRTCKTGRDYQVGLVYLDRHGRQSPVIVANDNTVNIPFTESQNRNRLFMTIKSEAPYWATHYRPFVKQNKNTFYNVIPAYSKYLWQSQIDDDEASDDVNRYYLRIYDADINKVDVGDLLVRKISQGEVLSEFQYWRVVETKRLISRNASTLADNKLPSDIPNSQAGYYVILAPTQDHYDVVAAETNYPATGYDHSAVWETVPADNTIDLYWETSETFRCINGRHTNSREEVPDSRADIQLLDNEGGALEGIDGEVRIELEWYNCFGYGNGVETMVVEDRFNGKALDQGARASTVQEDYQQADKKSWLIHSGVYSDSSNLNRLNEFNISLPLQKELDLNDGSIQHVHFRDTNLYVFQERKVKNIPINKNVIVTADGGNLTTAGSQFFGTERAYQGNYGISQNPESFASYGDRMYFADKNRGAIMRLSGDGLTEISKNGVEAYVRRYIAHAHFIKLFYNDYSDELDITFQNENILNPYNGNLRERRIAVIGQPDPQFACTQRWSGLDFETIYAVMHHAGLYGEYVSQFRVGDKIYVDERNTNPFTGGYRWYRVEAGAGSDATYDQVIQISDEGAVTAVVDSCKEKYPVVIKHKSFNISSESFQTELDACANGILDEIAYFGPQTLGDFTGREPAEGNYIYEGSTSLVRSTRSGWYKINIGTYDETLRRLTYEHYVLLIRNGVVVTIFNCDRIERGRVRFSGSMALPIVPNETSFDRNLRLCTSGFNDGWWLDVDRDLPLVGDTVYENNFTNDKAPEGYIHLPGGNYATINESGIVTAIDSCGEEVCTITPYDFMIPRENVPTKAGIDLTYDSETNASITWDVDSSIGDYFLNDYYELNASNQIVYRLNGDPESDTCDVGSANCFPSVKNDVGSNDSKAFENNDLVYVSILEDNGDDDTPNNRYSVYGRILIDDDNNYTLKTDNESGLITINSDYVYSIDGISNKYRFEFIGLDLNGERIGLPMMTLKWIEKGSKVYPKNGVNETEFTDVEEGLIYKLSATNAPDELSVAPVLSELCYTRVTGGNEQYVFVYNTGVAENVAATSCEKTTNTTWYYDPDVTPKRYYTNISLDESTLVNGHNLFFGIAYDNDSNDEDNASVTHVEQVDSDGYVVQSTALNCAYRHSLSLGFIPLSSDVADPGMAACKAYDDNDRMSYWADESDFAPEAETDDANPDTKKIVIKDGKLSIPPDGYYANDDVVRLFKSGSFEAEQSESCVTPLSEVTFRRSYASPQDACSSSDMVTLYSDKSYLTSEARIYKDAYQSEYAEDAYYSDGNQTGPWNKNIGDWSYVNPCEPDDVIDFVDPLESPDEPVVPYHPEDPPVVIDDDNMAIVVVDPPFEDPPEAPNRVSHSFKYSSTESQLCINGSNVTAYSNTNAPFDDTLYKYDKGNTVADTGFYLQENINAYRYWNGSTWSGADQTCITKTELPSHSLWYWQTQNDICNTASNKVGWFNGSISDSTLETIYNDKYGETTWNPGSVWVGDEAGSVYRSYSNGVLNPTVSSRPDLCEEPAVVLYTNSPEFGYNSNSRYDACNNYHNGNTNPRYIDTSSFGSANRIYNYPYSGNGENETDYTKASAGWYANGNTARQWNGGSFGPAQACSTKRLEVNGSPYTPGSQIFITSTTTVTGRIIAEGPMPVNAGITISAGLNHSCYAAIQHQKFYSSITPTPGSLEGELNGATLLSGGSDDSPPINCGVGASISGTAGNITNTSVDFSFTVDIGNNWDINGVQVPFVYTVNF